MTALRRLLTVERCELAAVAAACGVFLVYAYHAIVLILYPWDWSPDEGLFLDYARRLVHAPHTLYPVGTSVPFPLAWTPLLPALLVPLVELTPWPLQAARVLALGWTIATAAGVSAFVRPRGGRALAVAAAALSLAPLGATFWYMLVRMDGLMVALWLWAAVVLAPKELRRGAGHLGWGRACAGAALLAAAFLAKPTAVVHAAPLVLIWWIVDLASALRLAVAAGAIGGGVLALLQLATSGGFLWVQRLWKQHPIHSEFLMNILRGFAGDTAPLLLALAVVIAVAVRAGCALWRDAALGMAAGALLIVPALAKYGSSSNYLLPVVAAAAVLIGRWLAAWSDQADADEAKRRRRAWAALACALLAAATVSTSRFLLPTPRDRRAAEEFYRLLDQRGGPILALRPDYAYFRLGQPVEAEGSSFVLLLSADVPGIQTVPKRIAERYYRTIVLTPTSWYMQRITGFVHEHYRDEYVVTLGSVFGRWTWVVLVPRDEPAAPGAVPR